MAQISPDPDLGPPSLRHLYHFATGFDRFLVLFIFLLFFSSGALQGSMNLVLAEALAMGPMDTPTDVGVKIMTWMAGGLGGCMFVVFTSASMAALHVKHKMMQKWKVGYMKAILRQDIGWYDLNQGQNIASRMGEAMLHLDKAFAVPTYQGFMFLGNILCVCIIALVLAPKLACICLSFALVMVCPASFVLAKTVSARSRLLADSYSAAGGFAAEILGAMRTVAALGLERFVIARYDGALAEAEKTAVRTTSKLAFSVATIAAFTFYVCATASLFSLSIFEPRLRDSAFPFEAPVEMPAMPGNITTLSFCVPTACDRTFDPFLLVQALASDNGAGNVMRYGNRYAAAPCVEGYEKFQASCATGEGLERIFEAMPEGWLPPEFTRLAFENAGTTWPCSDDASFELILIVVNSIIFGFLMLPQVPASFEALMKGVSSAHFCLQLILRVPPIDSFSLEGEKPDNVIGAIEVKNVTFAYPAAPDFNICSGYTLSIPANSSCALVGPSGSGKSTIVNLLQRFYIPQSGVITLDGNDIATLNLVWLRSQLGLVGQEPVLFQGSVADNIRYGRQGATEPEIEDAAKLANASDFIANDLSDGFRTEVGQGGGKLSGGQKQRIAIARVLIKKPAVLLLDEATSALDYKSEKVVQAAIDKIMLELKATCIVIAHRLSTIRNCDKIAVVSRGRIVEQGTYDELLAIGEGGLFHRLAASQENQDKEDLLAREEKEAAGEEADLLREHVAAADESPGTQVKATSASSPSEVCIKSDADDEGVEHKVAKKKTPSVASRVGKLYHPKDKWRIPFGFFSCLLSGVCSGFVGLIIVHTSFTFRDEFDPDRLDRIVTNWAIASLCVGVFVHVLDTFYKVQFAIAGEGLTRRLRVLVLEKLLQKELGYFDEDENSVGSLTEFLAQKVNLVQGLAQDGTQGLITMLSIFITAIVISIVFGDWRLMLIFLFGYILAIIILVVGQMTTNSQEERFKPQGAKVDKESDEAKSAGALVGEVVAAIKTVCSFNSEHRFLERYAASVEKQRQMEGSAKRVILGSALMGLGMAFVMLIFASSLYYGMWLMENDPTSFMHAVSDSCPLPIIGLGRLMVPMMSFMMAMMGMGNNAAIGVDANAGREAAIMLFERIDRESRIDAFSEDGLRLSSVHGKICVQDVVFAYPTRPHFHVCRGYSLTIDAGTVCALVGPSGAGKSTLVNLLLRFYDPQSGVISLDGSDITTLNLAWLRRQMGLVGQEPVLFQGSVADNIRYGKEGATQDEIEEAAKQANAHAFITESLGSSYSTQVGLRGSQLSGGQKQRVAIARALVRQPSIMLLDEATSALDSESERIVQEALDEIMVKQKRTTVVIAHRLSTVRNADQIAVVSKGRIAESGTHEQLRDKGGLYAELLAAQSFEAPKAIQGNGSEEALP